MEITLSEPILGLSKTQQIRTSKNPHFGKRLSSKIFGGHDENKFTSSNYCNCLGE
jgi:hypothetical protein